VYELQTLLRRRRHKPQPIFLLAMNFRRSEDRKPPNLPRAISLSGCVLFAIQMILPHFTATLSKSVKGIFENESPMLSRFTNLYVLIAHREVCTPHNATPIILLLLLSK
jgi:hypothetical protein